MKISGVGRLRSAIDAHRCNTDGIQAAIDVVPERFSKAFDVEISQDS